MGYIGKKPATQGKDAGPSLKLDDVSSNFDGLTTVFNFWLLGNHKGNCGSKLPCIIPPAERSADSPPASLSAGASSATMARGDGSKARREALLRPSRS